MERNIFLHQIFILIDADLFVEYAIFPKVEPWQTIVDYKWETLLSTSHKSKVQFSHTGGSSGVPGVSIQSPKDCLQDIQAHTINMQRGGRGLPEVILSVSEQACGQLSKRKFGVEKNSFVEIRTNLFIEYANWQRAVGWSSKFMALISLGSPMFGVATKYVFRVKKHKGDLACNYVLGWKTYLSAQR